MNYGLIVFLILCGTLSYSFLTSEENQRTVAGSTLRFTAVILRHGSRSPVGSFPLNPIPPDDKRFWPNGVGELTQAGMMECFTLGRMLRKRYGDFLSDVWDPKEIGVKYCHRYGRDFRSALCVTAGLYPQQEEFIHDCTTNKSTHFNVDPRDFDIIDLITYYDCPKYRKMIIGWILKNADFQRWNKKILEYVSNNTGLENINVINMYLIFDALVAQFQNGYKLPKWSYQVFPDPIKDWMEPFFIGVSGWGSETLLRLGAGPELKHILDMMIDSTKDRPTSKKFYLEAAHDITILNLLISMGYDDLHRMESNPASYLTFELHQTSNGFIIKVYFFRSPFDVSPEHISISKCPSRPCTLDDFTQFVNQVNPSDWHEECNKL